ncbi:spermidine/putrescine transport system permease protein [Clostridium acetobutylicum]|uniref:ABC-type spermidine/putrescine transport system, permease component II n=1 Tax=Clostridium acetobutylicum (strain ATCC 824 / DSM 792 / JCM 1419 / IAM 19013 / LMG 5710 / NBRC 13948 / NRRL B-527 / VKM B-1787 / 2291 / W) TaxID=272562 RepID=Q97KS8_CLOAB|nr:MULTISPECIES: ABC transporter permease [Clostridium]AAK78814.1 ABC-type spermidine/putrescine transport system, permease component II [Clostridium acetobutylicum ATCC 824]ADZ19888.1 ABC-type spermidine/putrescine transport system, permease component II [Clostridium acetobutylicum EA 2018]AEI33847.1 ABC-type spermidine/putrescine transport system, permease component II [Clostridium acetobutylicum DSM 1731]AWV80532.1 ABC transporter permease [Clostridium acetobutylicum]KHD35856.1 spermidine/p
MVEKWLKRFYLTLTYIFLYAPIVFLMVFSFNSEKFSSHWGHFSLTWYKALLQDDRILTALYYTVLVAIVSSIISTIFGTISAIGISKMSPLPKKLLLNVNNIPVLNPDIVMAVSLMTLFIFLKIPFGLTTLIIAHIAFSVPYVILSVLPKLTQLPTDIVKAALDLGATPSYAMRKIILPQIKSGIIAGFLFAFTMSIDDFVISFFNTGNDVTNLSIEIYSMARRGITPEINALSTLMFVTILILLLLANRKSIISKGEKK